MSIKNIALATIVTLAFVAPTMSGANAKSLKHRYNEFSKSQDYENVKPRTHRYASIDIDTPRIDRRIERQRMRIRRGRRSGDLTWREARRLRRGLKRIVRAKQYAMNDDRVTRYERRELLALLDDNGQKIRRLRHNDRTANRRFRRFRNFDSQYFNGYLNF